MQRAELSFAQGADGALRIRLAGSWLARGERPAAAGMLEALDPARVRRVAFDASALEAWDSALVAFVARALRACADRGIDAERDGLPSGLRRLLALAEAVPEHARARAEAAPPPWLARVGEAALRGAEALASPLAFLGETSLALGRAARLRARFPAGDFLLYVQQCGAQALPIVTLIGFLIGLILAFMGAVQLLRFGATIYVADLVALAMLREMGAVMTAVVMAGRTGAAFAAQLGTMKVTEEIDALRTLGISPIEFLVVPRILALLFMMPFLCLYADFWGIVGGLVVSATMLDLSVVQYLNETFAAADLADLALGVVKSCVFGALVAFVSCLQGMRTGEGASAVGDAATAAVVQGIVLIIVSDGVFAVLANVLGI
jgi:phospholipid/cholesterol/gamma-HCH transport system permease protein